MFCRRFLLYGWRTRLSGILLDKLRANLATHCLAKCGLNNKWQGFINESSLPIRLWMWQGRMLWIVFYNSFFSNKSLFGLQKIKEKLKTLKIVAHVNFYKKVYNIIHFLQMCTTLCTFFVYLLYKFKLQVQIIFQPTIPTCGARFCLNSHFLISHFQVFYISFLSGVVVCLCVRTPFFFPCACVCFSKTERKEWVIVGAML